MSTGSNAKLVKRKKYLESSEGDETPFNTETELDALVLKRTALRKRGNWMQIGPEVRDEVW